jgi:uncharacterized protein CbrC (UPF0167 family)
MSWREKRTLAHLGAPFPLWDAPAGQAYGYTAEAPCSICGRNQKVGFRLGIGDDVIVSCPRCAKTNAVMVGDQSAPCSECGTLIELTRRDDARIACYECMRAGRVAVNHATEFGSVGWSDAQNGRTSGVPGLTAAHLGGNDFPLVAPFEDDEDEEKVLATIVPTDVLIELTRTPRYCTNQSETWMFHCSRPMVYVDAWGYEDFDRVSGGDPWALFEQILPNTDRKWLMRVQEGVGVYVHRCSTCSVMRGHYDFD